MDAIGREKTVRWQLENEKENLGIVFYRTKTASKNSYPLTSNGYLLTQTTSLFLIGNPLF